MNNRREQPLCDKAREQPLCDNPPRLSETHLAPHCHSLLVSSSAREASDHEVGADNDGDADEDDDNDDDDGEDDDDDDDDDDSGMDDIDGNCWFLAHCPLRFPRR